MAEKRLSVFEKTEPGAGIDLSDLDSGLVRPIGVGLREGEMKALDSIADKYTTSRGSLIRIAIRLFLRDYFNGKIDLSGYMTEPLPPKRKADLSKIR